jgi:hypothetical protein
MKKRTGISGKLVNITAAIAMAAAFCVPALTTGTAFASGTYCWGSGGSCPVFSGPYPSDYYFDLGNNAPVSMICWDDTVSYNVNYTSKRWFKIYNGITGTAWMHSSEVYSQTSVPHC